MGFSLTRGDEWNGWAYGFGESRGFHNPGRHTGTFADICESRPATFASAYEFRVFYRAPIGNEKGNEIAR